MNKFRLKKKYAITLLVLAGIALFTLILGGSYAFFTHQVTSKDYVIYTGNLQIDYIRTGSLINLNKAYPMTNSEGLNQTGYTFNITNNGSIDARYQIRLELDSNNTLPLEYIKMAFVKTKENNQTTNNTMSEPVLLSNLNNTLTFITGEQIEASKIDSYTLKMWIDYNAPNDITGKTFRATIVIDSLQDVEDGYVMADTPPIITLNKFSDGQTDIHLIQSATETFSDPGILSVKDDKDLLTEQDVNISYEYTNDGINLSTVNGINRNVPGVYYINYQITDSANNTGKAVRVVVINNTATIPVISLVGDNIINIDGCSKFVDPGVNISNNNRVITIGEVIAGKVDSYIIRYIVIDSNNNINSITRIVNVLDYCYFNNYISKLADNNGTTCDVNQINNNLLAYDCTNDNNLRYVGANPNNYISFNGELWRIIGVMNNIETNTSTANLVKIIKDNSIGKYAWNTINDNTWSSSSLNNFLNNEIYESLSFKDLIADVKWNISRLDFNNTTNTYYAKERVNSDVSSNIWNGKIGLFYPSDYGFATSGSNNRNDCLNASLYTTQTSGNYYIVMDGCLSNNWLNKDIETWFINPGNSGTRVMFLYASGYIDFGGSHSQPIATIDVFPTLYLKSTTKYLRGTGTIGDPYIIE